LPLNGLLALLTLGIWAIVWMSFGRVPRFEWLIARRGGKTKGARHARRDGHG
jgi:hypothetical protein